MHMYRNIYRYQINVWHVHLQAHTHTLTLRLSRLIVVNIVYIDLTVAVHESIRYITKYI